MIKIINMKMSEDGGYCTIGSGEACARLGISRDTLYAYVSRGLVRAMAHPADARKSLYDRRDIETLSNRKQRGRSRSAVAASTIDWGEPVLSSKITRIADGRFFYRGRDAVELSRSLTFEETLHLLAGVRSRPDMPMPAFVVPQAKLPFDRILLNLASETALGRRGNGRPRAAQLGRMAAECAADRGAPPSLPVHELLAQAWSTDETAADLIRRALVLCADHELNASTYAARVAASAGASLPAALLAGLSTLSGALHGGITSLCRDWMNAVDAGGPAHSEGRPPPGFGHPLYPDGDPRTAEILLQLPLSVRWQKRLEQIVAETGSQPTLDFGLAHLERALKLPAGSGLGIFAVGRTAGWIAHIFEQRETGRLIRPRAAHGD